MSIFKDAGHLFRFAALFVVGTLTFLGIRGFFVPKSFGEYGHYRGNAIGEIAARPIHYAGHQACETCHTDVVDEKKDGKHAQVNCEACHGPLAKHADDPSVEPDQARYRRACVSAVIRRAPPSQRASRKSRRITPVDCPARRVTSHTARLSSREVRNEPHSTPFFDPIAGCSSRLGARSLPGVRKLPLITRCPNTGGEC